jgi:hypothetical protein
VRGVGTTASPVSPVPFGTWVTGLDTGPDACFLFQPTEETDLGFGDDLELGLVFGHPQLF